MHLPHRCANQREFIAAFHASSAEARRAAATSETTATFKQLATTGYGSA
jgi:hypothetical protein